MKKMLGIFLGIMSILVLGTVIFVQANAVQNFVVVSENIANLLNFVASYGALIMTALWALWAFWKRGASIVMIIIVILLIACGVIVFAYPDVLTKIFGAK